MVKDVGVYEMEYKEILQNNVNPVGFPLINLQRKLQP